MKEQYLIRNLETGEITEHSWTEAEYYELMDDDMVIHLPDGSRGERYFPQRKELGRKRPWARPLASDGAGCHPSQVREFNQKARDAGFTGVNFTPDGTCNFSTRGQRAKYLKFRGLHDRSGGYAETK